MIRRNLTMWLMVLTIGLLLYPSIAEAQGVLKISVEVGEAQSAEQA